MRLKNCGAYAEIRAEQYVESRGLLHASLQPYSPRSAGITVDGERQLTLTDDEAEKFRHAVLRDDGVESPEKWSIAHLLSQWLSGQIPDEATAWAYHDQSYCPVKH